MSVLTLGWRNNQTRWLCPGGAATSIFFKPFILNNFL